MPARTPLNPTTATEAIGKRVARARVQAGLTQLQLGHAIGLAGADAGAAISRLESGSQEPKLGKLIKIAKALRVSLESLLPV